jgi:hypothetical protein
MLDELAGDNLSTEDYIRWKNELSISEKARSD